MNGFSLKMTSSIRATALVYKKNFYPYKNNFFDINKLIYSFLSNNEQNLEQLVNLKIISTFYLYFLST